MSALLLASAATPWIVFASMAGVSLFIWGSQKYREQQSEKRSQELRQLFASVNSEKRRT